MPTDLTTKTHETTRQLNRSHGSFELALAPVILGLIGLWLDRRLGTTPAFVIGLTVFGFIGAGAKLYFAYRYEMAQLAGDGAWKGHESTAEFRRRSAQQAERNALAESEMESAS